MTDISETSADIRLISLWIMDIVKISLKTNKRKKIFLSFLLDLPLEYYEKRSAAEKRSPSDSHFITLNLFDHYFKTKSDQRLSREFFHCTKKNVECLFLVDNFVFSSVPTRHLTWSWGISGKDKSALVLSNSCMPHGPPPQAALGKEKARYRLICPTRRARNLPSHSSLISFSVPPHPPPPRPLRRPEMNANEDSGGRLLTARVRLRRPLVAPKTILPLVRSRLIIFLRND